MFPAAPVRPPGSLPERSLWPFLLVVGLLAFAGIGLIAVGAVSAAGTSSFNRACAQDRRAPRTRTTAVPSRLAAPA